MPQVDQVGGKHYSEGEGICPHCGGGIQHWDWAFRMPYPEASACKYISRHVLKGGFESLLKAYSFLIKIMQTYYPLEYKEWSQKQEGVIWDKHVRAVTTLKRTRK